MKQLYGYHLHKFAPKEWRKTQDITGDHIMDESIHRCKNPDVRKKLTDYVTGDEAYGPTTGYSGYHHYRGDD